MSAGPRSAPVEFERGGVPGGDEADPFGLDAFLSDVKKVCLGGSWGEVGGKLGSEGYRGCLFVVWEIAFSNIFACAHPHPVVN